jgi:hypothetical protein
MNHTSGTIRNVRTFHHVDTAVRGVYASESSRGASGPHVTDAAIRS